MTKGGDGGNVIATNLLAGSFIDVLRSSSKVLSLNPTILDGLVRDVVVPRRVTSSGSEWIDLDGTSTVTATDPVFDQVPLSLKSVAGLTIVSHKMLKQSTPQIEMLVQTDPAVVLATALDVAAIQGAGAGSSPVGILNTTGIGSVEYTNAGVPTWDNVCSLESAINVDSALEGSLANLTDATMFKTLKTVERSTGGNLFIVEGSPTGAMMNGCPIYSTQSCPTGEVVFGNFRDLLIGMWGGLELESDPYGDNFAKGNVAIRAIMDTDIAVRHPESFTSLTEASP